MRFYYRGKVSEHYYRGKVIFCTVAMLEERGLPHHLLGALGSRMQYVMQKSFSSSISSSNSECNIMFLPGYWIANIICLQASYVIYLASVIQSPY